MEAVIKRIRPDEAAKAAELEAQCLTVPWSAESIGDFAVNTHAAYFVAECDGELAGICGAYIGAGECSVTNIAVSERFRRRGVASAMLEKLHEAARGMSAEVSFLEVAENNTAAIRLYEAFGYSVTGRRVRYYGNTDALNMSCKL